MLIFWEKGYEGSSLSDLTDAMEISKPTLYAAFGDKEGLLREAVRAYVGLRAADYAAALGRRTAREVAEAWLRLTGGVREESHVPPGCLLIQGALVGSEASGRYRANWLLSETQGQNSWKRDCNERSASTIYPARGNPGHWRNTSQHLRLVWQFSPVVVSLRRCSTEPSIRSWRTGHRRRSANRPHESFTRAKILGVSPAFAVRRACLHAT